MTTPGGGGDRLEVSVVADASGFARDAQAKIDAAAEKIRAKIKADIDFRRLQAQAQAAAKRIGKQTEIRLQIGVDKKYLLASLAAAVAAANASNPSVKIKVEVDREQLDKALAAEGGGTVNVSRQVLPMGSGKVDVPIHANSDALVAEVQAATARAQAAANNDPIDVPVQIQQQSAKRAGRGIRAITGMMSPLQKAGFYAGMVQTLASAAVAAGGGLFAMASAASQAVGVLGALPNVIGVAVQGMGALLAGFSGIGGAVGALAKVQTGAGKAAAQSAKQQEQAQRRIADARQAVIDATEQGSRRIAQAERGVIDSQKASLRAQEALNQARKDAANALEDYQLQLSGAALDEEGAALSVERSREAWNKAMRSPTSTALDRKEADLALRQAEQSLKEIQDRNAELRDEAAEAEKNGVEGAANVVSAKENVVDAQQSERDAVEELAQAHVDAARDIADAQQNVADAIEAAAEQMAAGAAAANLLQQAMDKLSPAGQEFARFIDGVVKPRMIAFRNAIQQQLLPGVQDAIKTLMTDPDPGRGLGSYLDVLQGGMEESGRRMGVLATEGAKLMSSPGFREDTATIMKSNNRALSSFGEAGLSLVNILRHLAVAAGPVVERFARFINTWMAGKSATLDTADGMERLTSFMERAGDRAAQLGRIAANLGRTLFGMGKAGTEVGDSLIDKFDHLTQKWAGWANSTEGQKRIREFFEKIQPLFETMGATISKVTELIVQMGENGGGSVTGMLEVINLLLDALNWVAASPLGPFISTLMQFGGAASVVGLLGGKVYDVGSKLVDAGSKALDFARGLAGGAEAAGELGTKAAGVGAKVRDIASAMGGLVSSGWDKIKAGATAVADLGVAAFEAGKKAVVAAAKWVIHAAAVTGTAIAQGALAVAEGILTAAQWLLNAAMSANPLVWIILAIGLLVAAFIWLWNNVDGFKQFFVDAWDTIKSAVSTAFDWVKKNWPLLLAILTGPIGLAVLWITRHWDDIKEGARKAFEALGGLAKTAMNAVISALNGTIIAGINVIIRGLNLVNPFSDIPKVPNIPKFAQGAIVTKPTLAVIGEDGDEAVIPLSAGKAKRRAELMDQAGLSGQGGGDVSGMGGWARLDSLSSSSSLAELVATSGGAIDRTAPGESVGTIIQEGAVQQYITNPAPETASGTLNSGLRRIAATGIFGGSGPAT